jgi:hypothetical protein
MAIDFVRPRDCNEITFQVPLRLILKRAATFRIHINERKQIVIDREQTDG